MMRTILKVLGGLVLLAAGALAVFRPYHVPTGSMEDTLRAGDRFFFRTVGATPERNSLAVFRYPADRKQHYIKRVVGMPGDRIRIADKKLWVNGQAAQEPWAKHVTGFVDPYRDNFPGTPNTKVFSGAETMLRDNVANGEVNVPAGKYFVLGDNRDNSLDSRYWGFIEASDIAGKPVLAYYSSAGWNFHRLR
jgi:signal peptidase I